MSPIKPWHKDHMLPLSIQLATTGATAGALFTGCYFGVGTGELASKLTQLDWAMLVWWVASYRRGVAVGSRVRDFLYKFLLHSLVCECYVMSTTLESRKCSKPGCKRVQTWLHTHHRSGHVDTLLDYRLKPCTEQIHCEAWGAWFWYFVVFAI